MKITSSQILSLVLLGLLCVGFGPAASAEGKGHTGSMKTRMLFAYSPGCPHCEYERPIVSRFVKKHPELETTTTRYQDLSQAQESLVEGTSGHPVMVFHRGDCTHQVVGETSLSELESEYTAFKEQCAGGSTERVSTGSGIVCH